MTSHEHPFPFDDDLDHDDLLVVEAASKSLPDPQPRLNKGNGKDASSDSLRFALTDTGNAEFLCYLF